MELKRDAKIGKEHREFFNIDMSSGWEEIAPGIEAKVLAGSIDETTREGHINRISRWAPNAQIDAVRIHDFYEEVFVASGTLYVAAQEDPNVFEPFDAYSFACRPPFAKHGPFKAGADGCIVFETQFYAGSDRGI
jgi:hypothetical protein